MLKYSQTHRPSKCSTFNTALNIFSQAQLFQNIISKSVCLLGTTAGVIRVVGFSVQRRHLRGYLRFRFGMVGGEEEARGETIL